VIMCVESLKPYDLSGRIVIGGLIEGVSLTKNDDENDDAFSNKQLINCQPTIKPYTCHNLCNGVIPLLVKMLRVLQFYKASQIHFCKKI
jgi:hypothetical protein